MKPLNPHLTTPDWLIIGMNRAMLGMIHVNIRLITAEFNAIRQKLIVCECIYSLHSTQELNHMYGAVFRRKE